MESKKKFTITIAVLAIALLISIATMIIVLVTANQNASSAVNVKYTAEEVYVELSAKAIIGATTTTFVSNGQTSIELSPTNTTGELSQPNSANQSINLNKTDDTVVFEYLFKNKTDSIDVKIDLTSIPAIKENLNVSYVYSDTKITNVAGLEGESTYTAQLLPAYTGKTTNKYVYIIAKIDNLLYNSSLEGDFNWALSKPENSEINTITLNVGTIDAVDSANIGTVDATSYIYKSLSSTNNPEDISLFPMRSNYAFMGWTTTEGSSTVITSPTTATTLYPVYKAGNVTTNLNTTTDEGFASGIANSSVTEVIIPDIAPDYLGYIMPVGGVATGAFNTKNITSVHFGRNVSIIREYAFAGCSKLNNVVLTSGVTSIGESAFNGCSSLTNISLPDSITRIETATFAGCSSLTSIEIPATVTFLGQGAFNGCGFTTFTIPETITTIETASLFGSCTNLVSVTLSKSVTNIGLGMFAYCTSLTTVNMPDTITSIDSQAFSDCSSLTSINIPSSVTSLGSSAFANTGLVSVHLPDSITNLNNGAFGSCTSLTTINIPSGVTSLNEFLFEGCTSLTSLTIPSTVTAITEHAFQGCTSLTSLIFEHTSWKRDSQSVTLNNPSQNATWFVTTYVDSSWTKQA